MENYLYDDLFRLEETHWWHLSKRALVAETLWKYLFNSAPPVSTSKFTVLDVGCGTGKNVEYLSRMVEVHGVDQSSRAVAFCQQRGLQTVIKASATRLPYPDQTFDLVLMLDILEHIDESALTEVYRVLKPGGILLITVPAFKWMWSRWDEVLHHRRRYTLPQLKQLLVSFGFMTVKFSYLYLFLLLPTWIVRRLKSYFYRDHYPSDFRVSSSLINQIGGILAEVERAVLWKFGLPFGTSVVGISRKPET